MNEDDSFILITGAAGFIGSRMVEFYREKNYPVVSVDHPAYFKKRLEHHQIEFKKIVDRANLFLWLNDKKPRLKAIIHLGACTNTAQFDLKFLQKVNLEYSQNLWDYASNHNVPFLYASSAATYGDGSHGYDDDEAMLPKLNPLNPYGQSKHDFDLWALAQERFSKTPPAWCGFKFFNVYGFGERHKGKMASVVLHAFDQIQSRGKVRLFKSHRSDIRDGFQKRDFIFVDDAIKVLDFALNKPIKRGIFNLGSGKARTFLELAESVFKEIGKPPLIEFIDTPLEIRDKYQYFTEAKMSRLKTEGYGQFFTPLETGIHHYVKKLLIPTYLRKDG